MRKEKSCGAVVYKREGTELVYLMEHMRQGHTSIPKGHVENNETEAQTALREIKEETNLEVRLDTAFREVISYSPFPGCVKDVVFFVAEAASEKLINQECEVRALEWMPFDQACQTLTHASDREVLKKANAYLTRK